MNKPCLLSRREFLRGTVAVAAAAGLPLAAKEPTAPRWQIGCYTRPWDQHEYRVALDGIAEAGYRYAGIMTAKGKSWVMITPETTVEEAAQIGEEVRRRGLKTASVYGDFKVAPALPTSIQALHRLIDLCVACRSPDLLLGGTTEESLYQPYYKTIAECCDYAKERHVRLTIKPHGGQNATGTACRKAIKLVGHKNFRLWYDPGNILYYSDGILSPVKDAGTVDGLVAGMSVKDFRPPKEVLLTPGTGSVNFPAVLGALWRGGFRQGPLLVECVEPGEVAHVTAEARKARLFLEQVLQNLQSPPPHGSNRLRAGYRPF